MTAEEYIKDFARGCSNELENGEYEYWLTPLQAEAACNLAREETIDKACEWISQNCDLYEQVGYEDSHLVLQRVNNSFIEDFRKAMEDNYAKSCN